MHAGHASDQTVHSAPRSGAPSEAPNSVQSEGGWQLVGLPGARDLDLLGSGPSVTMVSTDNAFCGIFLDATARGVMLSDRGKYATSVLVFGVLGILAGVFFFVSGGSDREVSLYFFPVGGALALIGFLARQILRRGEAKKRSQPRPVQGLVVSEGRLAWGTSYVRFGPSQKDSVAIAELTTRVGSPPDPRPATMRILVLPLEGGQQYHLKRLSFLQGDQLIGEATADESGVFYVLTGSPLSATPLPIISDAEPRDVSRTCVRNLLLISEALSGRPDLGVRLAIAYPKEGVVKWGLMLGAVGGLIAMGIEAGARNKLQKLLDEGGLSDSKGSLLELVEQRGWQLELV